MKTLTVLLFTIFFSICFSTSIFAETKKERSPEVENALQMLKDSQSSLDEVAKIIEESLKVIEEYEKEEYKE